MEFSRSNKSGAFPGLDSSTSSQAGPAQGPGALRESWEPIPPPRSAFHLLHLPILFAVGGWLCVLSLSLLSGTWLGQSLHTPQGWWQALCWDECCAQPVLSPLRPFCSQVYSCFPSLVPVADQTFRKRLLPAWCSYLAHGISLLLFATSAGVSVWIGVGFSSSVALMWLISGIFSFLASFLVWEPLKVRIPQGHKHLSVHVCISCN